MAGAVGRVITSWFGRLQLLVLVGVSALVTLSAVPSSASAQPPYTFTVTGTVTSSSGGTPIAGARVSEIGSYYQVGKGGPSLSAIRATTTTNAAGQYSLTVPQGDDEFQVTAAGYVPDTYGPSTTVVGTGETEDLTLAPASFSGTVTYTPSGFADSTQAVELYDAASALLVDTVSTDADGDYAFPAGDFQSGQSYYVEFEQGSYLPPSPVFYEAGLAGGTTSVGSATLLSSPESDLNIALPSRGDMISGTVRDASGGVPGVILLVYKKTAGAAKSLVALTGGSSTGTYVVPDLASGSYEVEAFPPTESYDVVTWYGDVAQPTPRDSLTVPSASAATAATIDLIEGGFISGSVTGPGGTPTAGVGNGILNSTVNVAACGVDYGLSTGNYGGFASEAVPPGTYNLFLNAFDSNSNYGSSFESGFFGAPMTASGEFAQLSASPVQVVAGQTTELSDNTVVGGEITGTVTNVSGQPVTGLIELLSTTGAVLGSTFVDSGQYTLSGIPSGFYEVQFAGGFGDGGLAGGESTPASPPFRVTAPLTTADVNLVTRSDDAPTSSAPNDAGTEFTVPSPPGPTIPGKPRVGMQIRADAAGWVCHTALNYQWYANGKKIKDATLSSLTLTGSDENARITVAVTGEAIGYQTVTSTSAQTSAVAAGILRTRTPKIDGAAITGHTLTVRTGRWTKDTKLTYQWYANRRAIGRATNPSLRLTTTEHGKRISVKVTGRLLGYTTETRTSALTPHVS